MFSMCKTQLRTHFRDDPMLGDSHSEVASFNLRGKPQKSAFCMRAGSLVRRVGERGEEGGNVFFTPFGEGFLLLAKESVDQVFFLLLHR